MQKKKSEFVLQMYDVNKLRGDMHHLNENRKL